MPILLSIILSFTNASAMCAWIAAKTNLINWTKGPPLKFAEATFEFPIVQPAHPYEFKLSLPIEDLSGNKYTLSAYSNWQLGTSQVEIRGKHPDGRPGSSIFWKADSNTRKSEVIVGARKFKTHIPLEIWDAMYRDESNLRNTLQPAIEKAARRIREEGNANFPIKAGESITETHRAVDSEYTLAVVWEAKIDTSVTTEINDARVQRVRQRPQDWELKSVRVGFAPNGT